MVTVEEDYWYVQVRGPVGHHDSGNREQQEAEKTGEKEELDGDDSLELITCIRTDLQ